MTTPLLDPQLEAFYAANPEALRPALPAATNVKVPPWYDNTVVELAGAFLAVRAVAAIRLRLQAPPPPEDAQTVAGEAWKHYGPMWMRFAVPAVKLVYTAGAVRGLTPGDLDALATDYAEGLGDYLNETSADALAEGFTTQLNDRWSESLAWSRVTAAYGLDKPSMRGYLGVVMHQQPGQRDLITPAAQMLIDKAILLRATRMGENEAWSASQSGIAIAWLYRWRQGGLPATARKRWVTHRGEGTCVICGPMNGQEVRLDQKFITPDGQQLISPTVHPGCMCHMELVTDDQISKNKGSDLYDRDTKGRFADREYRTRDTAYAEPTSPEVQAILDQLKGVKNPFGVDMEPKPVFGDEPAKESLFGTRNLFGVDMGKPMFGEEPQFGAPGAPSFTAPGQAENLFDQTKRQRGQRPSIKRIIHHVYYPKKDAAAPPAEEPDNGGFYLPLQWYADVHEMELDDYLIQPGDHFDFTEAAQASRLHQYWQGELSPDELDRFERDYKTTELEHGIPVLEAVDDPVRDKLDASLYGLTAVRSESVWGELPPEEMRYGYADEERAQKAWVEMVALAGPLWNTVLADPERYIDNLDPTEIRDIYNTAGYEAGEDEFEARSRISHSCKAHGLGQDDSLADAFADYMVWNKPQSIEDDVDERVTPASGFTTSRGNGKGRQLADLIESADELEVPTMKLEHDWNPIVQMFAFDAGFHPDTGVASQTVGADLHGHYAVHHIVYRSSLAESITPPAFVPGVREAYLRPCDKGGHFLHGGGYPEP